MAKLANAADDQAAANEHTALRLGYLPANLTSQCRCLIESYHDVYGYTCLPDMLWRARLNSFIERYDIFRQHLRKASTTRSAKRSNQSFVEIATTILSLEILASSFAGWSALYPEARVMALATLKQRVNSSFTPLMDFYLYPPKYINSSAIAKLKPPPTHPADQSNLYRTSAPELADAKRVQSMSAR